ncbi:multidrug effflux MFS transporter [Phytohabitans aurantiacus]|uniref:Bcr/CflA family drug resistance efflux transporter n=1 Tax=Phytohabitans aurantiacus TaxID=3016789 RepID=A0ABQ5QPN0_9ACTN|nr:multidrug effflux MFS transporter [Phytohabitans aurantiacus]GLH96610.1 Bcr/CflA family drug resistance efflux transporter [Phytohabitans aurantiacus]
MEVTAPAPARRRDGAVLLALLGALTAIGPLSLDMYLPALPQIADGFAVSDAGVQLSLTACLLGLALGQLLTGPLSDRWGRRRPVVAGVAAYAVASLLCAFAPSAGALVALRFAQGLAGGVGVVVARAVVRDMYSGAAAARYFSRLTLVFGLAPIAAPALGSVVLRFTSWRGVFVALALIGALLAAAVAWRLPETLPAQRRSAGGLTTTLSTVRLLASDRSFIVYALAQSLAFAGLFAYISGSSFVFQDVFGLPGGVFSLLFGLNAVGLVAAGQLNARLVDRYPPRRLLWIALAVGLGAAVVLLVGAALGSLALIVLALFVFVASVGMVLPNGVALALDGHGRHAGTAAAAMGAVQSTVGAVAAPLVGLAGTSSALPMAAVIAGTAALSLATVAALRHTATAP